MEEKSMKLEFVGDIEVDLNISKVERDGGGFQLIGKSGEILATVEKRGETTWFLQVNMSEPLQKIGFNVYSSDLLDILIEHL